jgi:TatD DNase family protein
MYLIDTHAHIYLQEFDSDRDDCIKRALEAGVDSILMPAIDSTTHDAMLLTESTYTQCLAMIGLHPCSVNEIFEKELAIVREYLQKRKFCAIGEIGLDFYWDKTYTDQQFQCFHAQVEMALQYDIPIAIHSRNATDECIEVIRQYPALKGVFHCFSGTYEQAVSLMDTHFMMGIGGVATFKNGGLDKILEKTGIERVILETDAPYLAPVPFRGKRNEPAYTRLVAEKLADITGLSLDQVAEITTENARQLFKL